MSCQINQKNALFVQYFQSLVTRHKIVIFLVHHKKLFLGDGFVLNCMDFIKKRVRQFQEKKLDEILNKIQFHKYTKKQLEQKKNKTENAETIKIREEISFNEKMINIWQNNEKKLRQQMSEMED